jgi:hypothetical protein
MIDGLADDGVYPALHAHTTVIVKYLTNAVENNDLDGHMVADINGFTQWIKSGVEISTGTNSPPPAGAC